MAGRACGGAAMGLRSSYGCALAGGQAARLVQQHCAAAAAADQRCRATPCCWSPPLSSKTENGFPSLIGIHNAQAAACGDFASAEC